MKNAVIHIQEVDGVPEIVEMAGERHRVLELTTIVVKVLAQSMKIPPDALCKMMTDSLEFARAMRESEEE